MKHPIPVTPGSEVHLGDFDADDTGGIQSKKDALKELDENIEALADLSYRLYAESRRSLLLVLQGMDTAGKDGTIRHVMRGFNPQNCQVTSFKQPSIEELNHDFLWRISRALPRKGCVGIFNRSHYEDVLIVRVHQLVPEEEWKSRYERINAFEKLVTSGGTTLIKMFLHIGKEEQRKRLQARLDDPKKHWKFSRDDLKERGFWHDYQRAYEDALTRCSAKHAPWHVVPANRRWYRNLLVSRILRATLEQMDPHFPAPEEDWEGVVVE